MTDQTRAEALDKLAKLRAKIGYPDKWRDYSRLEVHPDDLLGNVLRADSFEIPPNDFAKLARIKQVYSYACRERQCENY